MVFLQGGREPVDDGAPDAQRGRRLGDGDAGGRLGDQGQQA
jgi:hypothetical protein